MTSYWWMYSIVFTSYWMHLFSVWVRTQRMDDGKVFMARASLLEWVWKPHFPFPRGTWLERTCQADVLQTVNSDTVADSIKEMLTLFSSELFEISHIRTIYHMFLAVLLIFCLSTLAVDYIDQGRSVARLAVRVRVCVDVRYNNPKQKPAFCALRPLPTPFPSSLAAALRRRTINSSERGCCCFGQRDNDLLCCRHGCEFNSYVSHRNNCQQPAQHQIVNTFVFS